MRPVIHRKIFRNWNIISGTSYGALQNNRDTETKVISAQRQLKNVDYHWLFTMPSPNHWSQDYGSQVVNRMSSQVNHIKPFKIKVQFVSNHTGHFIAFRKNIPPYELYNYVIFMRAQFWGLSYLAVLTFEKKLHKWYTFRWVVNLLLKKCK